jgi:hypothetical protein
MIQCISQPEYVYHFCYARNGRIDTFLVYWFDGLQYHLYTHCEWTGSHVYIREY